MGKTSSPKQSTSKRGFQMPEDIYPIAGLPSSEDLDAIALEEHIAEETAAPTSE